VLPLTSAITVLKFGPVASLVIHYEHMAFPQEVPVSQLADYVTEKGNPGNHKRVKEACLELPVPFLRRGLEFVDTPGVGSAIEANTETTYSFLPQCDAVLFVTSVDTPMTAVEIEFLHRISQFVHRVFFVVNKTDLLGEPELRDVLPFVTETIRAHTRAEDVRLFPLSSRRGLEAKVAADMSAYEASGLTDLEEALAHFLAGEKASAFLAAVAEKAVRLLDEEVEDQPAEAAGRDTQQAEPDRIHAGLASVRARLVALRDALVQSQGLVARELEAPAAGVAARAEPVASPQEPLTSVQIPEPQIARGLRARGCPVCQHIAALAFNFLAEWQHVLSYDERAQADFAAELGFCPLHLWQLVTLTSPNAASVGCAKLVQRISQELSRLSTSPGAGASVQAIIRNSRSCRVCRLLREAEGLYLQRLGAFVARAEGRQAYARSHGLCLRHLGLLATVGASQDVVQFLLMEAARRFDEAGEDMQGYAMKHEGLRRSLQNQDERDAYLRAIIHIVGEKNLHVAREEDGEM